MRLAIIVFVLFCINFFSYSQEKKSNTIEQSIDSLYIKSSSWEFYKLIKKNRYQNLKKEILDSLYYYKSDILFKNKTIRDQKDSIKESKEVINTLSTDLKLSLDKRNQISFLGTSLTKTTFQIIVWSIILTLIVVLLYFMYQFKNSHVITKNAKNELHSVEEEFEAFKKKVMTKEQKLRRQLQDEINKQRGV